MADVDVQKQFELMQERLTRLEERMDRHAPVLEAHGDQLSDHATQLADLRSAVRENNRTLSALSSQVGRLSDVATTQGLSLERIEKATKRVLEILEPRKVIVGE